MIQQLLYMLLSMAFAIGAGRLLYPALIKLSRKLNFTDKPNARKLHKTPVPVVGGIGVVTIVASSALLIPSIRSLAFAYPAIAISLLALGCIGMVDDKLNLPASLRLLVQLGCSIAVASGGIRLTSLHGFMGIGTIPVEMQYILTVVIITGVTNAINLIDGIDGLAGLISLINVTVLAVLAFLLHSFAIASLLSVAAGVLVIFLRYNWRPAKLFMGDAGSLFLGFLMSVAGIYLIERSADNAAFTSLRDAIPVILFACFAVPVIDAIRVFGGRMRQGRSPFSADKTHLHHKLLQHFMVHSDATRRIVGLHATLIATTILLHSWFSISMITLLVISAIVCYSLFLDFAQNFSIWYRRIKHYEDAA